MKKDLKIVFAIISAFAILVVGAAFLVGGRKNQGKPSEVLGIEATPKTHDLGSVPIQGGIVSKTYEIKNTTPKTLKLKKLATSCMCTTAAIKIGDKTTKFFGMEGHGDANPPVNLELASGERGEVLVNFDPAAHGPEGTGPFDRAVWLTFTDPVGVKELTFSGTVVKE